MKYTSRIPAFIPEKQTSIFRDLRNFLEPFDQEAVKSEMASIALELKRNISPSSLLSLKNGTDPRGVFYLARCVRTEFELWNPEHHIIMMHAAAEKLFPLSTCPPDELQVDDHPCHPDNFSAACVQHLLDSIE